MNIKEAQKFIEAVDLVNKSPLITGLHGIGKSEVIRQYAEDNGLHCETLILSLMDTGDLLGLPRTAEVGGQLTTVWAAPAWFNRIVNAAFPPIVAMADLSFKDESFYSYVVDRVEGKHVDRAQLNDLYCTYTGVTNDRLYITTQNIVSYAKAKRSVLFLDEFNRAPIDVLNASLQLVLDKRLSDHLLPSVNGKPTFVIAAINPSDADYTVNSFDPALLDRFIHGTVEANAKAWLDDYARPKNLAQVVRDFIAEHPDRLHWTPADGGIGATPRSWTSLASIIDRIDVIAPEVHFQVMKGCIGHELASQFLSYYNNYSKVVKVEDVEKLVTTKAKRTTNVETLGEHVNKLIATQEAMQKTELAENLFSKYITAPTANDALVLLSFLYGLDLEILNAFLKNKKESDLDNYLKLAEFDNVLNKKGLFKRITTKIA